MPTKEVPSSCKVFVKRGKKPAAPERSKKKGVINCVQSIRSSCNIKFKGENRGINWEGEGEKNLCEPRKGII